MLIDSQSNSKGMKIAILGTRGIPNNYGGFEQCAEYLSVGLVNKGHEVTVYSPHFHPYREDTYKGVKIIKKLSPENLFGSSASNFIYDYLCFKDAVGKEFDIILELGLITSSLSADSNLLISTFVTSSFCWIVIKGWEHITAGVNNLLGIYKVITGESKKDVESNFINSRGYGDLKIKVAEVIIEELQPIRKRYRDLMENPDHLDKLLSDGAEKARSLAEKKMEIVKNKIGLVSR